MIPPCFAFRRFLFFWFTTFVAMLYFFRVLSSIWLRHIYTASNVRVKKTPHAEKVEALFVDLRRDPKSIIDPPFLTIIRPGGLESQTWTPSKSNYGRSAEISCIQSLDRESPMEWETRIGRWTPLGLPLLYSQGFNPHY